jgi:hypothetical protein
VRKQHVPDKVLIELAHANLVIGAHEQLSHRRSTTRFRITEAGLAVDGLLRLTVPVLTSFVALCCY